MSVVCEENMVVNIEKKSTALPISSNHSNKSHDGLTEMTDL